MNKLSIEIESKDKKKIEELLKETSFAVEKYTINIEAYAFNPTQEEARAALSLIGKEPLSAVSYSLLFVENVDIPKDYVEKLKVLEDAIDLEKDTDIATNMIEKLPTAGPKQLLDFFNSLGLANLHFDYFKEELRNLFPYHKEPHMMSGKKGNLFFSMGIKRGILHGAGYMARLGDNGMRYYTQLGWGASYNPKEEDLLDECFGLVEKAQKALLKA